MAQALHILKKDIRYLRLEIGLFLVATVAYAWAEFHQINQLAAWSLLAIAAVFLIGRVIHAEAIPGDNQFWISRPYRWKSLLGAKLLFLVLFINLPVFVARLTILLMSDFSLPAILPGLLWSQFLILAVFSIPIAALAAITAGLVPFVFSVLVLVAVGLGMQSMMVPPSLPFGRTLAASVQWVWDAMASIVLLVASASLIWLQYKNRNTRFSRILAIAAAVLVVAGYLYLPWPVALAVQTRLSSQMPDSSTVHAALDRSSWRVFPGRGRLPGVQLVFPIAITGVPEGMSAEADGLTVSLRGAQGWTWRSSPYSFPAAPRSGNVFMGLISMPNAEFDEERERPVTLKGSIYVTLFGNERAKRISLTETPVDAVDGLQCADRLVFGERHSLYCRSIFRWPARRVVAKFDDSDTRSFVKAVSYSPFPAELSLDNVVFGSIGRMESAQEVTIVTTEPLKNIRLDFAMPNIRLADFAEPGR